MNFFLRVGCRDTYTIIDYSIFKNPIFSIKENKNMKLDKNQYLNKVTINKHNIYTATKRCYKENSCFKNSPKSLKNNLRFIFSKFAGRETSKIFFNTFVKSLRCLT